MSNLLVSLASHVDLIFFIPVALNIETLDLYWYSLHLSNTGALHTCLLILTVELDQTGLHLLLSHVV